MSLLYGEIGRHTDGSEPPCMSVRKGLARLALTKVHEDRHALVRVAKTSGSFGRGKDDGSDCTARVSYRNVHFYRRNRT